MSGEAYSVDLGNGVVDFCPNGGIVLTDDQSDITAFSPEQAEALRLALNEHAAKPEPTPDDTAERLAKVEAWIRARIEAERPITEELIEAYRRDANVAQWRQREAAQDENTAAAQIDRLRDVQQADQDFLQ